MQQSKHNIACVMCLESRLDLFGVGKARPSSEGGSVSAVGYEARRVRYK